MDHSLFNELAFEWHLGNFQCLAITDEAAMNIGLEAAVWKEVFSVIVGLYGKYILSFEKENHTVLQSACTFLHSPPQGRGSKWFLCIFARFIIITDFHFSCSHRYVMIPPCCFNLE